MKKALIITAILVILLASLLMWKNSWQAAQKRDEGEVLRLHVVANSDAAADQQAKQKVREAIMPLVASVKDAGDEKDAERILNELLPDIRRKAEDTLQDCAMDYGASAGIGTFDFPAKSYGARVYPAGEYRALKVVLGKGKGENWWCVIFPPLCIFDAAGAPISMDGSEMGVQYKSIFEELWEMIFGKAGG